MTDKTMAGRLETARPSLSPHAWPPPARGMFARARQLATMEQRFPAGGVVRREFASVIQDRPRHDPRPDVRPPVPTALSEPLPPVLPPIPFGGKWKVLPYWKGQTAFVVASGPSIANVDFDLIRGRRIIAVNSSVELVPFAEFCFFGDGRWWEDHKNELVNFPGHMVTVSGICKSKRLLRLNRIKPTNVTNGFAESPDSLASQRTSLQGGMNLAAHLGATTIALIGADMGRSPEGVSHGHKPHKWVNRPGNVTWDEQMACLKWIVSPLKRRGISVVNCNPQSRIPWWPKTTLEEFLLKEKGR